MTTTVPPQQTTPDDQDDKLLKEWKAFQRQQERDRKAAEKLKAAAPEERAAFEAFIAKRQQVEDAKQDQEEAAPAAIEPPYPYDEVFGLPDNTTTPAGYKVTHSGVFVRQFVGTTPQWVRIAFAPLAITTTYADASGEQSIELAWTDRGRVVRRMVARGIARRGRELIKELGSAGLPIIESDARAVERWLAEFETANRQVIPHEYVARYLGWQPDGTFVCGPEDGTRVDVAYDEQKGPAKAHRHHGKADAWRAGIAPLESHPVPRVVVAAALAAPLLRPLGVKSFTVDISSRSTRGKTTVLQAGLSVWADPGDDAEAMATWRTTMISIEKRLNLVRGIVTVLDETMTVESEEIISSVLYDLPKGVGKARGGGWPSRLQWETVLLSTGERPALSYSTHQGAAARVLSLTRPPFGEGGGPVAVALRDCVLEHYGHAGPEFVRHLLAALQQDGGPGRLRQRHAELTEQLRGSTDMSGRRAPMVAAVALAEQLACTWGVLPYEQLPLTTWQAMFSEVADSTDNRPEMAMDVLRGYVAGHASHLYRQGHSGREDQPHAGWLGIVPPAGSARWVAITPDRVRQILDSAGYALDAVLEGWIDAGYLELSESQRPRHLLKKKLLGAQARYLVFTPAGIDYRPYEEE